jgi:hypothetical protein
MLIGPADVQLLKLHVYQSGALHTLGVGLNQLLLPLSQLLHLTGHL